MEIKQRQQQRKHLYGGSCDSFGGHSAIGGETGCGAEVNGVPRVVEVAVSKKAGDGGGSMPAGQERADPLVLGSIGAPMAGSVIEVSAKPGAPPPQQLAPPVACQKGQGAARPGVHAGRSCMAEPHFCAQRGRGKGGDDIR